MFRYDPFRKPGPLKAYSFFWVTLALFLVSWVGQFISQYFVEMNDAMDHNTAFEWSNFFTQFLASTFENWQSEFLQLCWQALGLTILLHWGSSQSREGDDRLEAKVDQILEAVRK
jgi:hypothetical protein